uniref:HET domain-containing protein n=1 Tax=Globodera pallida TaxID=36090 RepID=A0A183CJ10_GLOPA
MLTVCSYSSLNRIWEEQRKEGVRDIRLERDEMVSLLFNAFEQYQFYREFVPNRLTVAMNGMQWQPDQRWVPRFYFHLRSADECRQFWHLEASIGRCRLFWMDVSCPSPRSERLPVAQHFCACAKRRRACQGEKECIGHEGEQDEFWRWRE